jgi:hypothetical protein
MRDNWRPTHAHHPRGMPMLENIVNGFGHHVSRIDGALDVFKYHIDLFHPVF